MNEKKEFNYSYKSPTPEERKEIDSIRRQYETKDEESKLVLLRRLDSKVQNTANAFGIVPGVLGLLLFGLGLTMILEWSLLVGGIFVSVLGLAVMISAYPIYRFVLKRQKEAYGEEILRLSHELLNEDKEIN